MGAYGHKALRPTTLATNYPEVISVNDNYNFGSNCVPPSLLSKDELESWSNGFKEIVKGAIVELRQQYGPSDDELTDLDAKISKLTRQQKEEWTQHLIELTVPSVSMLRPMDISIVGEKLPGSTRLPWIWLDPSNRREETWSTTITSISSSLPTGAQRSI